MSEISRRKYLRYAAGAAIGVAAVAGAAYGIYEYTKPPPKKKEITLLGETGLAQCAAMRDLLPEFEEEWGVKANWMEVSSEAIPEKAVTAFGADVSPYDVILAADTYWHTPAWAAGDYMLHLDEYIEKYDFPLFTAYPHTVQGHQCIYPKHPPRPGVLMEAFRYPYDPEKHYISGMPAICEGKFWLFRKDWYAEAGITPCKSYDDVIETASKLTVDAGGKPITDPAHGEIVRWGMSFYDPDTITCSYVEEMLPAWGVPFCDEDFIPNLDDPMSIDSLRLWKEIYQSGVVPAGSEGLVYSAVVEYLKNDLIGGWPTWGVVFGDLLLVMPEEKLGMEIMPSKVENGGCQGGKNAVIPYNSASPEEAYLFTHWLCSKETQSKIVQAVPSQTPGRYDVLEDPTLPWPEYRALFKKLLDTAGMFYPLLPESGALESVLLSPPALQCVYHDLSPEDAAAQMQKIAYDTLAAAGYYE